MKFRLFEMFNNVMNCECVCVSECVLKDVFTRK